MSLPFAVGESSTGYPFPGQGRVYSYSSDECSRIEPGIISEANDAAAMASAFRARNDLYACGSMHYKAARCYFRAAEGLQSDPVARAGLMLLCHSHAMRAKEFEGINDSATELLKEKRTKIKESVVEEKGTPTIQENGAENVADSILASTTPPPMTKLSASSLTVSPAQLECSKVISSAEGLLELERHLDLLGMKPISVTTNRSSIKGVSDALDAAESSHKQVAASLSTAQYLSSTLGESFYLLPQSIIVGKPASARHAHFVPTPESPPTCQKTNARKRPTVAGEAMVSTKEEKLFSRAARHILTKSWRKGGNSNNNSMHIEKKYSGEGETKDQTQDGGVVELYTTVDAPFSDDASAEVTRLLACIQRLSNKNMSLLKERESMKSIYDYAHTSQVQMEDFRAQYRAKYAELRSALEEFRQHNPSPRQFSHPGEDVTSLTQEVILLENQLQREKALSREKDATIKQFSNFYKELKERAARKHATSAAGHHNNETYGTNTGKNSEGGMTGQEEGGNGSRE